MTAAFIKGEYESGDNLLILLRGPHLLMLTMLRMI